MPLTVNVIAAAAFVFLVVLSVYCLPFVANKDDYNLTSGYTTVTSG